MVNKVTVMETDNGGEFENLPEGCIANVLSFTTPHDACILSLVSSTFRSAAQSDVVWDRFLPSDYLAIISQSSAPLTFSSKKHLYLQLCQNPLLIDSGKKSFALDKPNGKKCYMLSARNLFIVWGDTPRYWRWTSVPTARFSEVAELVSVCWLEIKGRIKTHMLSPNTLYGAYLVYKQSDAGVYGFENQPFEVCVGVAGEGEGEGQKRTVYLEAERPRRPRQHIVPRRTRIFNLVRSRLLNTFDAAAAAAVPSHVEESVDSSRPGVEYPMKREDGWWEVELGEFFNGGGGEDKEVEMGVYEVKSGEWKGGIVVQGFEIRPKR
ncbi:putative F-box protein PP2-B12 [Abrus precatorius]|uniref:F-box protein PP2-B12 n=1 Tax=Abrus precatorius TaxID=3816 RepID=A0A8B8L862_ABRPR|nr:putative F-box protein PP2-B12 [Abrus precatorius]